MSSLEGGLISGVDLYHTIECPDDSELPLIRPPLGPSQSVLIRGCPLYSSTLVPRAYHSEALEVPPRHHLMAVGEANLEVANCHHLLFWVRCGLSKQYELVTFTEY